MPTVTFPMTRRSTVLGLLGSACFSGPSWGFEGSDAAPTLQALFDATPVGGTITVPAGRHFLKSPLRVLKPLTVLGQPGAELVNGTAGSPLIVILASGVTVADVNMTGRGVFSNAEGVSTSGDAIVVGDRIRPLDSITLRDIRGSNIGDAGISIQGAKRGKESVVRNVTIENVFLRGVQAHSNYHAGIYVHGGSDIRIAGSDIAGFGQSILTTAKTRRIEVTNCDLHHSSKQHAIYLSGDTEYATVSNNRMYDLMGTGVKCSAPFSTIVGNQINRAQVWGINLKANLTDVSVLDNVIADCGNDGIDAGFERPDRLQTRILIARNRILRAGDFGINFAHDKDNCTWRGIRIEDNIIEQAKEAGIRFRWARVTGSVTEDISIQRNTIQGCGGPAIVMGREGGRAKLRSIQIIDNIVSGNALGGKRQGKAQIELVQASESIIRGNEISSTGSLKSAIDIRGGWGVSADGNQISGGHQRAISQRP